MIMFSLKKLLSFCLITILITKSIAFNKHGINHNNGETNNDNFSTKSRITGEKDYWFGNFGHSSNGTQDSNSGTQSFSRTSKTRNPISIAVQTKRTLQIVPVQLEEEEEFETPIIEISSNSKPLHLHFRSQSSRLSIKQSHTPSSPQQVEKISTQDEPFRIIHQVIKPVIQEVREVIQPYRNVVQTISPVIENVNTIISKGEEKVRSNFGDRTNHKWNFLNKNDKISKEVPLQSSSAFDSVFSHKNIDSNISQKTIDSDLSHGSNDWGSSYSASNYIIYRISPLITRKSGNFDNSNAGSDENKSADLKHKYLSVYPVFRFL